jgi:hypothetical protein
VICSVIEALYRPHRSLTITCISSKRVHGGEIAGTTILSYPGGIVVA